MGFLLLLALGASPIEGAPLKPPAVAPSPVLPDSRAFDADGDLLEDAFAARLASSRAGVPVRVEFVFRAPLTQKQLDAFHKAGGTVEWVFQSVSHGFLGSIAPEHLRPAMRMVGDALLLVLGNEAMTKDLDRATQNARARAAWTSGFADNPLGFTGSPSTTIAFVDTGIDDSHSDLVGRGVYWRDFQGTSPTPIDYDNHGSCVASVALGTGAAFEASQPVLKFTRSTNFVGIGFGSVAGRAPLRFGPGPVTLDLTGVDDDTTPARLNLSRSTEGTKVYGTVSSVQGLSPLSFTYQLTPGADQVYSVGLVQGGTMTWGTTTTRVRPYPVATDGMPTFRGMAPGCSWASAHASDDVFSVEEALDDLMTVRADAGIKVLNLSQSPDTDGGTLLAEKMTTMVQGGVLVVKTAGNNGRNPLNNVSTPAGLAGLVLTVGATNTYNVLTSYTSIGKFNYDRDAGQDLKPDLLAPGGSLIATDMICADSNDGDSPDGGVADQVPNDYQTEEGTSFAAPIVAGAAGLVIQALESKGLVWSWASPDHPRLVKALLLATATETNVNREREPSGTPSPDPLLGRSARQKDLAEGYGLLNVDAAVEAATLDLVLPMTGITTGGPFDRRAWARRVALTAGTPFGVALSVPTNADFDVYLYGATPDPVGNPVLRAAADRPGMGLAERLTFTPTVTETGILVVKRISGSGSFQLVAPPVCGNNLLEPTEECEDGNTVEGDCCSSQCLFEPNDSQCPQGSCRLGRCEAPLCDNRIIEHPETCDDGNALNGDCCSSRCQLEPEGQACNGGRGACTAGVCIAAVTSPSVSPDGTEGKAVACSCGSAEGLLAILSLLALRRRWR
jgi:cysteine-rich repeat protein